MSRLETRLALSHIAVGLCVTILSLAASWYLVHRSDGIEHAREARVELATKLPALVNSAFEEGLSFSMSGEAEAHDLFFEKLSKAEESARALRREPGIPAEETTDLDQLLFMVQVARDEGNLFLADEDPRALLGENGRLDTFSKAMDGLRDFSEEVGASIQERADVHAAKSHGEWKLGTIAAGVVAFLFALAFGILFGRSLARPIKRVRDAVRAFGQGENIEIGVGSGDALEVRELAVAFRHMSIRVDDLLAALDRSNRNNRLLLDNVAQGLLTIDADGTISTEHSSIVECWFGPVEGDTTLARYLHPISASFSASTAFAWDEVVSGVMPLEVTLEQMPRHLQVAKKHYEFAYQPIRDEAAPNSASETDTADVPERFLVVVSDVTSEVERRKAEQDEKETLALFEHIVADRTRCRSFVDEGSALVMRLVAIDASDYIVFKRDLHTLKGTSALFGITSVARACHELETRMEDTPGQLPSADEIRPVAHAWADVVRKTNRFAGSRRRTIEITEEQHAELLRDVMRGAASDELTHALTQLRLEPMSGRLREMGEQATRLATREGRPNLVVATTDAGIRFDTEKWARLWSSFTHLVRNAVGHGIENPEERLAAGKPEAGHISLRAWPGDSAR